MATQIPQSVGLVTRSASMKYIPFNSLTLGILLREEGREKGQKKSCNQKQFQKSDRNESYLSQCEEKSELWQYRFHLCLSFSDSNSDKEAADMGCDNQRIKLSTQQDFRKNR
ncbi:hypothetical protein AVEN_249922-1 [Araneus ventricosus]|uniref:Uncharacterized protein n=1 Tax=Araneus ventricosus TaxID=182803 RepID=A0A4Y2DZN0_ARAVE|nr:hypothetical protein AVEN_249922-1 [Araneus ventricosus]